jgi:thiamine biosynthesis lipoprotein
MVGGEKRSHLLDPRTLQPAEIWASATVIAADCLTANALATAGCLLDVAQTLALAARHGSAGQLMTRADGKVGAGVFATVGEPAHGGQAVGPAGPEAWPKDFQLTLDLMIGPPNGGGGGGRGGNRPYIAIWVEDADHQYVQTLSVLGTESNYRSDLIGWRQASVGMTAAQIKAVTRATRPSGLYSIAWDGRDHRGQPAPQGTYYLCIEIDHERGHHITEKRPVECGAKTLAGVFPATAESGVSKIEYGAKGG